MACSRRISNASRTVSMVRGVWRDESNAVLWSYCGVGLPLLFDRVSSQHTLGLSLGCLDCSVGGRCSCTAAWKTQVNRHKCCATATIGWCWIGNRKRWLWMGVGGCWLA